jgi:uncharacterized protein with von Willebrand factor type A (vWA) domain
MAEPVADADRLVVAFARLVRGTGLEVPVGATITLGEAWSAVGLEQPDELYWAGRVVLVHRPEDVPRYDRAFRAFWHLADPAAPEDRPRVTVHVGLDADADADAPTDDAPADTDDGDATLRVRWSPAEVLRTRDFAACSHAELDEARRLIADLRVVGARRRSRRHRPTRRDRGRPDLRRTVRRAMRATGEPVTRAFRAPTDRPRRIVLLCDVSGSMEPYARALLRFLHTAVVGATHAEAFALGTRLTRLTRELSSRDADEALAAATRRVTDWSGGTRLGQGLRAFNDRWGVRGLARGATVVILSDGWDRGDPALLAAEMARLHRVAHRVVWVNPLKATPEYAPLARGMAAALPHVDEFVTGHSVAALEDLVAVLGE